MLGGHLDSWHAATGAADNAASCSVAMEAVRILQAVGARPKRTIRVALWSGEEQGLLGSRGYVRNHFATRPLSEEPEELKLAPQYRERLWPITPLRDHEKFSAYFNLDNGGGRFWGFLQKTIARLRRFLRHGWSRFTIWGQMMSSSATRRGRTIWLLMGWACRRFSLFRTCGII